MAKSQVAAHTFSALILLGALLITNILIAGAGIKGLLIACIILSLMVPMGLLLIQGKLDLFEPLVLGNIALGIMFIGRPLADLATGRTTHLGYDITTTFDQAMVVVLVGIVAFQLGYLSPFASLFARRLPSPTRFRPNLASQSAWIFFLLGGLLFGLFLAKGGGLGLLLILLRGRGSGNNVIFLNSTGYFYNGITVWMASALIFFALATVYKRRKYYMFFMAMTLPILIFYGARGTRSQMLPLILAVPIFWYLCRGRRPSARTLLIAAVVGIVLVGWLREIRTAATGSRGDAGAVLIKAFSSPLKQFCEILNGADDEMFDSIANELLVVPDKIGYKPEGIFTEVFVRMVPRPLWPDKPLGLNDTLVNTLWPKHYALSRASAAFSVLGPFYFDGGYVGVSLGMFMIGIVLSGIWKWFHYYSENLNAILIYSMGLPFVVILMRGTIPGTLARMLFIVIPLVLVAWFSRLRFRPHVDERGPGSQASR